MALYAGFWGPEALLWSTSGTPVRDTPVTVLTASTMLLATLYVDEQKSATAANPVKTDSRGNLSFFAVPGEYFLRWAGATPDQFVVVGIHPDDPGGGGGGVTDHGLLTGLADDDHSQYHNNSRGDVRYYLQSQVDTLLSGKANSSHTHVAAQITDLNAAVDARIQNVIGTAPAALDTLGELADALGDDANFAATVTTALAGKQSLDADLTALAALAPADGSVIARVSGVWNSRTMVQLKGDLGITAADVGLGNVANLSPANLPVSTAAQAALDLKAPIASPTFTGTVSGITKTMVGLANVDNTSDAGKPISTATQAALDQKAPRIQIIDPMTKYGILAAPGRFGEFQGVGSFANQWTICRCFVPANSGALTRMTIPVRSASAGYVSNGKPNHLGWWDDDGVFQSATPDDSTMWSAVDWYVATLGTPVPNSTTDKYVYGGMQINGQTGGGQFVLTSANDSGTVPFSHAPGSSKRFAGYAGSVATLTDFNPNTFGTLTSFVVYLGFMA